MVAYLGGFRVTADGWDGNNSVFVAFLSHYADRVIQLYAGRTLIGVSATPAATRVVGQLTPSDTPTPLTLVAVLQSDALTNYGPKLPRVPWNRYELHIDGDGYISDDAVTRFEISASEAEGEAVEPTNILGKVPYIGARAYVYRLPPLASSGEWTFRSTPYDDAKPDGNAGTETEVTINALIAPPDFELNANGNRFEVDVVDGQALLSFSY